MSWNLSCKQLESLEITFNNILSEILNLLRLTHIRALHHVAGVSSIISQIIKRFFNFLRQAYVSDSSLISHIFNCCHNQVSTTQGFKILYYSCYYKHYYIRDIICADSVCHICLFGPQTLSSLTIKSMTHSLCCYLLFSTSNHTHF